MTDAPPIPIAILNLLGDAAQNAADAAKLLLMRLSEHPDSPIAHDELIAAEHRGDALTAAIGDGMATAIGVSPSLRYSVTSLASSIDDVVDHVERVSDLLDLYSIEAAMQQSIDQAEVLTQAIGALAAGLATIHDRDAVAGYLEDVKAAEEEGDRIERQAVAALFADPGIDPRAIIQWKDVFEGLEAAIDRCERSGRLLWALAATPGDA